ncbi:beta-glucosidase BglX [Aquimarina sp. MMG015]|uniref:beta-glucosidase BglX n=1 Tax=Aquimarina TaxID=290174 RepID=UPI000687BA98|nr:MULTISPECIES: beta-glucosidase BglX [Aquimarina]AXT58715.1 beta-glucosidase BglX [Aquimarina sp. AD1]MBQ4802859.1 beta-glucosidase BglX [Aquimarina sp. MMG015]RKN16834.1 beta-glucosidase BglX [Aquimarina sp. AD1]
MIPKYSFSQNKKEKESSDRIEKKVDSLIAIMTLKEKIGQLVLYNGSWDVTGPPSDVGNKEKYEKLRNGEVGAMLNATSVAGTKELQKTVIENSRLKIPLLFGYDVIHGFKTIFPIPLGESASWDLEAITKSSSIAAKEATASGINWAFGPMMDISRDARWGRVMEGAGEDPFLASKIAVARIEGFQGDDLSKNNTLAACAKHFAAYGFAEGGRDYNTVSIGEYELHNTVLPPFKAAVDAGVASMMSSFNEIDGIPATGHKGLQRDILKKTWDWDGFIVSDWASIAEMIFHGYAKDKTHAAELAMKAGNDMDMEGRAYEAGLEQLVKQGKVDEKLIEEAAKRILRVKFKLGLFDDPFKYCDENREKKDIYTKEHLEVARDVARKSIVLLKNDKNILPLKKNIKSIAVIGPLADDKDTPIGSWRGMATPNSAVSLLEGIKSAVEKTTKISYAKGVELGVGERSFVRDLKVNREDFRGIEEAVKAAKDAEVVVLAIGEEAFQSGEARSQVSIELTKPQQKLFKEIYAVNKNIVVVLMNGRPMAISNVAEKAPSILETWHLGSTSGSAIADVLFGDYNPSGKLPVSFPRHVGQLPIYYNVKNTGRPVNADGMVFWSHYTDEKNDALFSFGHGLSYTKFKYKDFKISSSSFTTGGDLSVSVTVTNAGERKGKEVVQLYIRDLFGSLTRPVKELKDFKIVELNPKESQTVTFKIDEKTIQFYTANKKWEAEPGDFKVFVGGSSKTDLEIDFSFKK